VTAIAIVASMTSASAIVITKLYMKLIIPKEVEERIHGYAMSVDSEIAGMGKVRVEGDSIIVEEVMIYDQEATGATADLSQEAIAKWLTELVRAGDSPKMWKLWFHSHHTMPAFFSGRDTATIDGQTEGDWLVSLVVNCKREREARLDLYRPFRMFLTDLEIEIQGTEAYTVPADIAEEVARKVKRPAPTIGYAYKPVSTIEATIGLHRYCPTFTMDTKECYMPYGKNTSAVYANCASKEFKKKYGASPFIEEEEEYTKPSLTTLTKDLEARITQYENAGAGDTTECKELARELVDAYYDLAELEMNETKAEKIRAEARQLENTIYSMTPYEYD